MIVTKRPAAGLALLETRGPTAGLALLELEVPPHRTGLGRCDDAAGRVGVHVAGGSLDPPHADLRHAVWQEDRQPVVRPADGHRLHSPCLAIRLHRHPQLYAGLGREIGAETEHHPSVAELATAHRAE